MFWNQLKLVWLRGYFLTLLLLCHVCWNDTTSSNDHTCSNHTTSSNVPTGSNNTMQPFQMTQLFNQLVNNLIPRVSLFPSRKKRYPENEVAWSIGSSNLNSSIGHDWSGSNNLTGSIDPSRSYDPTVFNDSTSSNDPARLYYSTSSNKVAPVTQVVQITRTSKRKN